LTAARLADSNARRILLWVEGILTQVFGAELNPFYYLGALGFYFFWVVVVSGAYVYAFYKTGIQLSYPSVESITLEQWYLGGIMRSLHRYASDALIVVMLLHLVREFILGRYRGARWFAWITGIPLIWLIFGAGINGYWMVWDKLAQYLTVSSVEWFDWLPVFGEPMSRSFLTQEVLNDRFFSLISFAHVTVPLLILFLLWVHIMRISYPVVNPKKGLTIGMLLALIVLSIIKPALSQGPADMSVETGTINLDWFYMFIYPLLDIWSPGEVWALVAGVSAVLAALPWFPSKNEQIPVAEVSLKNCSGCRLCVADCPYEAVVMRPRTDGLRFLEEAVVFPNRCVSCGICVGSCPSSSPFRGKHHYVSGIEMPSMPISALRSELIKELTKLVGAGKVLVVGCDNAVEIAKLRTESVAVISLPCTAMLPPSFIEYALREQLIGGVFITGCRDHDCYHRVGVRWTMQRLASERKPSLRNRTDVDRIKCYWAASSDLRLLESELATFRSGLNT
jgi:ferredoxin/coenzyme F420-reducing hydrogenase delta subunit